MSNQTSDNNKRIAKNTLLLYFRMLILLAVSLYTSRVVLNALGVVDYGVYNVVGGVIVMLSSITGSLSGASSRFITYALGKEDISLMRKTFGNVLFLHIISAAIVLLLGETIGLWFVNTQLQIPVGRETAAFWVYQFSIFSSILAIISVPYNAAIIAHEKMSAFAYITIIDAVLKLLVVYLIIALPFDRLILYSGLYFLIQIFDRVVYGIYCSRHFKETQSLSFKYDRIIFNKILSYSFWTLNGSLAVFGYTQGLNILLNIFFGPAVNAARGIAVQVQSVCQQFCNNFQVALNPQLTKSYARGDFKYMHELLVRSSKFSFFILFFIALPLMFESQFVLKLWLGIVPSHTVIFLRLVLVIGLLFTLSNPVLTSVHATGQVKIFQIIEATMLLMIVPVAWCLLHFFGVAPETVFIVHIVIEIMTQIMRLFIVCPMIQLSKKIYLKYVVVPICKVVLLAPIIPYFVYRSMSQCGFIQFFLVCSVCVICLSLIIFFLGCTKAEQQFIMRKINSIYIKVLK